MAATVTVYTTQYCPYCVRAKQLLANKGIAFEEVDLSGDPEKRQELSSRTGWMTVPMVFIGEKLVGGADELSALDASGELDRRVAEG